MLPMSGGRCGRVASLIGGLGGLGRCRRQAGNWHGTAAARHRGVGGGVIDLGGRDVAHDPALSIFSLDAVNADIDDHGTSLDPIAPYHLRPSRPGTEDIPRPDYVAATHFVPVPDVDRPSLSKERMANGLAPAFGLPTPT